MKKFFLIICALTMFLIGCSSEPPVEVKKEKVLNGDALTLTYDGKISASNELKIFSPISGNIVEKYFEDGADVEERQKLFKVGSPEDSFELSQAKVALAESMTALAKASVDNAPAASELQFEVEKNKQLVQNLETATEDGIIYAPKAGRLGAIFAPIGIPVVANETLLATVGDINPVVVSFELSAAEKKILAAADGLKISLNFSDGSPYNHNGLFRGGEIYFNNPDEFLLLGTTAQVVIDGVKVPNALLVPEIAIQSKGAENFVYIDDNKKVAVRKILLGDKIGTYYIVKDGLKADDLIITDGFQNLREGTPLKSN